jgi:hypothetical protein
MILVKSIWLRLTDFRGMFFASAVVVPGGDGGGAGDGAGDGGAGGGGGEGGGEGGGGGDEGVVEGEEEIFGEPGEGEGEERDESASGEKPRSRAQAIKEAEAALSKLRETDPALAKVLRKEFFETKDYRATFPTVAEARAAKETIEDLGGDEGISNLKTEVNNYAEELASFAEGNPVAVDKFARDYPKGLVKLTPLAVAKMKEIDRPGFERMLSREMAGAMFEKGFTHSADRMMELLEDGKVDQAKALAKQMRGWISSAEQFGKAAPATDPEQVTEIEKQRQELAKKETTLRNNEIGGAITKSMNRIILSHLTPLMKGRNLNIEQKRDLASGIYSQIEKQLHGNENYQSRLRDMLKKGLSAREIDRYVSSQVAKVARKSTHTVWANRGFSRSGAAAKPGAQGGGAGAGRVQATMGRKPDASEIDWSKDRNKMRYISGEATLKNGQIRKWDTSKL